MWKGSYGKEPFDLRLTVLRLLEKSGLILLLTLAGTVLFGGGYYLKNITFGPAESYRSVSTYKVDYADPEWGKYGTYINETTWNTWVHTDEFIEAVKEHLDSEIPDEEIRGMITAKLASDLRVPSTYVTAADPAVSEIVAEAVEQAMTEEFPEANASDITAIRVIDSAAPEVVRPDVRPLRAVILAAVLSLLFVLTFFLLAELGNDSILLPASLKRRYGLPVAGSLHDGALAANLSHLLEGKEQIMVVTTDEADPLELIGILKEKLADEEKTFVAAPSPLLVPETGKTLRKADAILLAVSAGSHAGRQLEYLLEYLETQDCKVDAAVLTDEDRWLLKNYYRFSTEQI